MNEKQETGNHDRTTGPKSFASWMLESSRTLTQLGINNIFYGLALSEKLINFSISHTISDPSRKLESQAFWVLEKMAAMRGAGKYGGKACLVSPTIAKQIFPIKLQSYITAVPEIIDALAPPDREDTGTLNTLLRAAYDLASNSADKALPALRTYTIKTLEDTNSFEAMNEVAQRASDLLDAQNPETASDFRQKVQQAGLLISPEPINTAIESPGIHAA